MKQTVSGLVAGVIFGVGLGISGMVNPAKVLNFLDPFGNWDPTLAVVMASALIVNAIGYQIVTRRSRPLFARVFSIPTRKDIDAPLIAGAGLFGVGWGLVGLCPGPALTGVVFGYAEIWGFVAAMIVGALGHDLLAARRK